MISKFLLRKSLFVLVLMIFQLSAKAQCDSAIVVTMGDYTLDTIPNNGAANPSNDATDAVWFQYTHESEVQGKLGINSCFGGNDTRLWVYSGSCNQLTAVADSDDECPVSGSGASYASGVEFIPVNGTTYFIEWDDKWNNNGFDWSIEFIPTPAYDLAVRGSLYSAQIPLSQAETAGVPLRAAIENLGLNELTNINISLEVFSLINDIRRPLDTLSLGPINLAGDTKLDSIPFTWQHDELGKYEMDLSFTMDQEEESADLANNLATFAFEITENTYALESGDDISRIGSTGLGSIVQAQNYYFGAEQDVQAVQFYFGAGAGVDLTLNIYTTNAQDNTLGISYPDQIIYSQPFEAVDSSWTTVVLDSILTLEPGTYAVGVASNVSTSIDLYRNNSYHYPNNSFLFVDYFGFGPLWYTLDVLEFEFSYLIRLVGSGTITSNKNTSELAGDIHIAPNPTNGIFNLDFQLEEKSDIQVHILNTLGQTVYTRDLGLVQEASTQFDLSNLGAGIYTILLTDGQNTTTRRIVRQ